MSATRKGANPRQAAAAKKSRTKKAGKGAATAPTPPAAKPAEPEHKLTPKQLRFIEEYPKDFNATQAAIRAGYSKGTAGQIGFENLTKPDIQAAIAAQMRQDSAQAGLDRRRLIQEAQRIALLDPRRLFTSLPVDPKNPEKGTYPAILPPEQWPDDVAAAVASVEFGRVLKVRTAPKLDALVFLMKYGLLEADPANSKPADEAPHAVELAARLERLAARIGATS